MPHHTDKINIDKSVCDDQNVQRGLWSFLGQTSSVSLFVFLSQLFGILLVLFAVAFGAYIWPRLLKKKQSG